MPQSYLDLVRHFPYYADSPQLYHEAKKQFYEFRVSDCDRLLGHIPATVIQNVQWPDGWTIDHVNKTATLGSEYPGIASVRSELLAQTMHQMAEMDDFSILKGWRNETFPVYGPRGETLLEIERSGSALFGIVTYGVQLTCYMEDEHGLRIWIGRRSRSKQTYPGMLDSTAAGGLGTGRLPGHAVVREAVEEASLPESVLEKGLRAAGYLSYYCVQGPQSGGADGLLQPEVEYVYELKLDANTIPEPGDSEVEEFHLWTVDEVGKALKRGEFKPNSAIVLVDFFIRHGILTPENDPDFLEIVQEHAQHLEERLRLVEVELRGRKSVGAAPDPRPQAESHADTVAVYKGSSSFANQSIQATEAFQGTNYSDGTVDGSNFDASFRHLQDLLRPSTTFNDYRFSRKCRPPTGRADDIASSQAHRGYLAKD
ncbi:thiamine pyrophosphokinase-related protein [Aspergillus affinis]|uniref:thiamine pyrophosphokinase-related protein n=1 Tax=Aspergillus affinis TaxID=1070780 RepID=UPI0022FDCE9D|nr:thiamine pyrophosphokinase-related protein [Aspergillus affinis]KAI9035781.1 thiamine pyrophosphokinase-related protein [Aspergillus affinis]